ncbi:MAG: hypothetical protein CL868_09770 [Cytophagaceae bacterium]|nr:hypothetical protein [Cytophagaceae bacterium]|tara:strand:+ start:3023 stop:4381 length:1359 start_codon:yes stop_codon:yes gene_type:complete
MNISFLRQFYYCIYISAFLKKTVCLLLIAISFSSCVTTKFDKSYISESIKKLSDFNSIREGDNTNLQIPSTVNLEDGLAEDEAISMALYNNAQFQADLIGLSLANADLVTAGQLPNPLLSIIFPTGTDPLKGTLNFAIDALWQRPSQVNAAHLESERTALTIVNKGLQLIRDTRIAYANTMVANEQLAIGEENILLRSKLAQIINKQYRAGEISQMEASLAISDSTLARQDALRAINLAQTARLRLFLVTGLDSLSENVELSTATYSPKSIPSLKKLLDTAFVKRTDLKAAKIVIEAKGKQLGWERSKIISLMGVLSARRENGEVFVGPGFNVGLPIFNWNRGNILRKNAEMKQAAWQYILVKRNISLEVKQAFSEYETARANFELWNKNALAMDRVPEQARKAYEAGEVSYFFYLETLRRFTDFKLRSVDAEASLIIAEANLNYAIGTKQL